MQKIKVARKILRIWAVIFPFSYIFFGKLVSCIFIGVGGSIFLSLEFFRYKSPDFEKSKIVKMLIKESEKKRLSGITLFILSSFLLVLFFPKHIAITALFFAIFGDLTAELIGKTTGRVFIFGKTLEGTAGCFTICVFIGLILRDFYGLSILGVFLASLIAALTELIPLRLAGVKIDDNFSMGLVSALALWVFS